MLSGGAGGGALVKGFREVIGFAGLSHLGICSSIAAACNGFRVAAFDENTDLVKNMIEGEPPIVEPDLEECLLTGKSRMVFGDRPNILRDCEIVYISRDVPTLDNGQSNLQPIVELFETILPHLREDAVLVILCQVPPGFSRSLQTKNRELFYQVETLIFGQAMRRAQCPDRIIIGCRDSDCNLPQCYQQFLNSFGCPLLQMKYESAELTKIAINCFLAGSVTMTNTLAEICEHMGADWFDISPALHLDKRIGRHAYLSPGLGLSGGNIERDLVTILGVSRELSVDASAIEACLTNSNVRKDWALDQLREHLLKQKAAPVIAVWGLAYKENTKSTKNAPSLRLLKALKGLRVKIYDPVVEIKMDDIGFERSDNMIDALQGADALVVMTPWSEFATVNPEQVTNAMVGRLIIDPHGIMDGKALCKLGCNYARLGSRSNEI